MCNAATVTVNVDDEQYDAYCEGYKVYDKEELEKAILDIVFDRPFWEAVSHYMRDLDISPEAKEVLFNMIKKQTVICVSAPELT